MVEAIPVCTTDVLRYGTGFDRVFELIQSALLFCTALNAVTRTRLTYTHEHVLTKPKIVKRIFGPASTFVLEHSAAHGSLDH